MAGGNDFLVAWFGFVFGFWLGDDLGSGWFVDAWIGYVASSVWIVEKGIQIMR